jgi:hypothetical protein
MNNRPNRAKLLAAALIEANRKAERERADKQQIERISATVKAKLAHIHASADDDLVCPSCGYKGPEADFEPDTDEESDSCRTDDVTSESSQNDEDDEGDRPEWDNKVARVKAMLRNLTKGSIK